MRFLSPSSGVVFTLGFFALSAQTLLFRDFLAVFEGTELGIACFFGSWLVWICLGALSGRRETRLNRHLAQNLPLPAMLYLPAFVCQQQFILHSRSLVGVESYTLFPLGRMVAGAFVTNAPTSFLTGLLFPLACRWKAKETGQPVTSVYIVETLGSLAGSLAVPVLLVAGVPSAMVAFIAFLVLAAGTAYWGLHSPQRRFFSILPLGVLLVLGCLRLDGRWTAWNDLASWKRLLPEEGFQGGFATPQSRYLYGEYDDAFLVLSWGSVTESLPGTEHASETVALSLAQNPAARRILLLCEGGLAPARRLIRLPQVEKVTWLHPDPTYPDTFWKVLPERFRKDTERIEPISQDIRTFLAETEVRYDLVIIDLPDPTTLVLNRFFTVEFQEDLKKVLTPGGTVCIRFSGGANHIGEEAALLGASLFATLRQVYQHLVLKPGDESWWIASDGDGLTESAAVLRERFAAIPGAEKIYPPEGLLSLYLEDRIRFQRSKYQAVLDSYELEELVNRDSRPKSLFFSLLPGLRQTGWTLVRPLTLFSAAAPWMLAVSVVLYGLLRFLYLNRGLVRSGKHSFPFPPLFDGGVLVFLMGFAGISLNIFLLFRYQSRFGSLFLEIGLVTSLFMAGTFLGGWGVGRLLKTREEPWGLVPCLAALHSVFALVINGTPGTAGKTVFALLFVGAGIFTGVYFPIVARRFQARGISPETSGSILEIMDHAGGAVGSILTGLVLIPVVGTQSVPIFVAAIAAVQILPHSACIRRVHKSSNPSTIDLWTRRLGYVMTGVGAFFLISSAVFSHFGKADEGHRLYLAARAMSEGSPPAKLIPRNLPGNLSPYYIAASSDEAEIRYFFSSDQVEETRVGFGGPIRLALVLDDNGTLRDFTILDSNETPAYLRYLEPWFEKLKGHFLFEPDPFPDLDAVTGATLTSRAVLESLEASGKAFGVRVIGVEGLSPQPIRSKRKAPDRSFIIFTAMLLAAVPLRMRPGRWRRRLFLAAAVVLCGWLTNLQYSSQQIFSIFSLNFLSPSPTGTFLLLLGVPVLTLFMGNLYCGYLCPFGALQELIGEMRPDSLDTDPEKPVWRIGRFVKYVLLFILAVSFSLSGTTESLTTDPLITFFASVWEPAAVGLGLAALAASFFYRRFWCRNLCPAGAFLSLLGGVSLLKRFLPSTYPSHCDLGIKRLRELDCLTCDRCRFEKVE